MIREMRFYLTFGFLGFKVVSKRTMNLFKGIQEIIPDPSKFEKLNKDPILKREASVQRFYVS